MRKDFDPAAKEQERTLEQLLVDLRTATNCDTQLRTRSARLMALMASDLRDARRFPTEGALAARPMRAWLQRYNGIEFLQAAKRHHAQVNAQALRMAWLAATRRIRADWARLDYLVPPTR